MVQGNSDDGMSHMGGSVPANHHEAMYQLAKWRDAQLPRDQKIHISTLLREAIAEYLTREIQKEDVPEEIRDLVDDDLLSNGGGTK